MSQPERFVEAVGLFAGAGVRTGEAVLLVMTEGHRQLVREQLEEEGLSLEELESSGRFLCIDAQRLLASFLFDGILDEYGFKNTIGVMSEAAKKSSRNGAVRVFGEMVDLICTTNPEATERLEALWNQVIEAPSVPLLCAYFLPVHVKYCQHHCWRVIPTLCSVVPTISEAMCPRPANRPPPRNGGR